MQLVEQHIIDKKDSRWKPIDDAMWASKNIYNAANYKIRQSFINGNGYIAYLTMEQSFKQKDLLPDQQLPMKVVQQVLRQVDHDWVSFFAALDEWNINPDKFTGRPHLPKYKNVKAGRNMLIYTQQTLKKKSLTKGIIQPSQLGITIQTKQKNINQVRIVPRKTHYVIEVVYTVKAQVHQDLNPKFVASGDLGIGTLCALTSNKPDFVPLLVNGRVLKSINHQYNKNVTKLQSRLPENQHTSRQIDAITDNRNRKIRTELQRCSRMLIDLLVENHIGVLVIGKNIGWKQEVNLGAKTNQNFTEIPHAQFIDMLTYKAKLVGIKVILREESYTSKCSFLDLEPIGKHEVYQGKRVKRGLFRASDGRFINADVNGSYNILRKAVPKAFANGIKAAVVQPARVYPLAN